MNSPSLKRLIHCHMRSTIEMSHWGSSEYTVIYCTVVSNALSLVKEQNHRRTVEVPDNWRYNLHIRIPPMGE